MKFEHADMSRFSSRDIADLITHLPFDKIEVKPGITVYAHEVKDDKYTEATAREYLFEQLNEINKQGREETN